jgi:hypothetical protein
MFTVPRSILEETFSHFRGCGRGRRECQVLWTSPWKAPEVISSAAHPIHDSHAGGFEVESDWLTKFCLQLSKSSEGVRVQVHTHPAEAFHSVTDDEFPFLKIPGFLSLVIPRYALGPISFHEAYLAEVDQFGAWREISVASRLRVQ